MASVFHLSLFLVFLPPIPDSVQPFLVSPLWLEISTFLISSLHWPTPQTVPLYPPSLPFHHPLMLAGFYFWSAGLISWSPYVTTNSSVRLRSLPTCSGHSFDFQDAEAATLPSPSLFFMGPSPSSHFLDVDIRQSSAYLGFSQWIMHRFLCISSFFLTSRIIIPNYLLNSCRIMCLFLFFYCSVISL